MRGGGRRLPAGDGAAGTRPSHQHMSVQAQRGRVQDGQVLSASIRQTPLSTPSPAQVMAVRDVQGRNIANSNMGHQGVNAAVAGCQAAGRRAMGKRCLAEEVAV